MTEEHKCYQFLFKTATLVSTQDYFLSLYQQENCSLFHTWDLRKGRGGGDLSPTAIC